MLFSSVLADKYINQKIDLFTSHTLMNGDCANNGRIFVLIMVIELSGVQFGLKSYAWFQNRTSAQREFDLKSQVWFQTKIARPEVQLPLY